MNATKLSATATRRVGLLGGAIVSFYQPIGEALSRNGLSLLYQT